MKQFHFFLLTHLFIFLTFNFASARNFNWKLGSELGHYRLSEITSAKNNQPLLKFTGSLAYKGQNSKYNWGLNTRLKQEIFGLSNSTASLKLFMEGFFNHRTNWGNWGVALDVWRFNYSRDKLDLSYNLIQFQGHLLKKMTSQLLIASYINYVNKKLINQSELVIDAVYADNRLVYAWKKYWQFGGGFYIERFQLDQDQSSSLQTNRGWRFGPKISFKYQKKIILQLEYNIFWHRSEIITAASYDQRIRLVFGKLLSKNWSVFALVDYYFSQIETVDDSQLALVYSPLQNENVIHFKLEHDFNQKMDGYFKVGYVNEDLVTGEQYIRGWQVVLGIEIGN